MKQYFFLIYYKASFGFGVVVEVSELYNLRLLDLLLLRRVPFSLCLCCRYFPKSLDYLLFGFFLGFLGRKLQNFGVHSSITAFS